MKNPPDFTPLSLVLRERASQRALGYSDAHDDAHASQELRDAAIYYAALVDCDADPPDCWPFPDGKPLPGQHNDVALLTRAATLLIAELERYYRKFQRDCNDQSMSTIGCVCFAEGDPYGAEKLPWSYEPLQDYDDFIRRVFGDSYDVLKSEFKSRSEQ